MAEGGSNGEDSPSRSYLAVEKLMPKLIETCKESVRRLAERFSAEDMITPLQKTTAFEGHNDDGKAAVMIFSGVLRTIARKESAINSLIRILREEGFDDLASKLCEAVSTPQADSPNTPTGGIHPKNRLKKGASWHSGICKEASPPPDTEEPDSGIASRNPTGLQAQLVSNSEPQLHLHELVHGQIGQRKLLSASLGVLSRQPPKAESTHNSTSSDVNCVEEDGASYEPTLESTSPPPSATTSNNVQLVTPVQVNEPKSYDMEQHQAPVQVAEREPHPPTDVILVPDGDRILGEGDVTEEDLREDLQNMRQELQQMKAQGMQKEAENVVLQDKCTELEEKVEKTSEDLRIQKEHTTQVLKEKDEAINTWKQLYDEKVGEVEKLRSEIAVKEKKQDEMQQLHEKKINEIQDQHQNTVKKHEDKILSLEKELDETKQRKTDAEVQLAHAKEQLSKAELQKVQAELEAKENMHKLVLETMQLKVLLANTKTELAEERKTKSDRELVDQRRQSVQIEKKYQQKLQEKDGKIAELEKCQQQLQQQHSEIAELKRLLSQKSSDTDSSQN